PSDVTGISIYDQRAGAFEYRPGPLSANVVLVDEINRATPRAQSALLEAMQERQVTVDETTHTLPDPFLVIATQNPVELEGTFPLPEAQLDRFLFLLNLGYPDADDEDSILQIHGPAQIRPETLEPILSPAEIAKLREEVRGVRVGDAVRRYAVEIVRGTRRVDGVELGASPRAPRSVRRRRARDGIPPRAWPASVGRDARDRHAAARSGPCQRGGRASSRAPPRPHRVRERHSGGADRPRIRRGRNLARRRDHRPPRAVSSGRARDPCPGPDHRG
ncbi:MAG: hypothetical protein E6J15_05335, partial [Chloroflexi bacterium]